MFPSPVSFFASRKVRDSFGVQNGFFFQAWSQAFFWLRASRKPAAAAGIKERENEKKGTKEKRERDERKDFFIISFGSVGTPPTASITRSFQLRTAEDGVLLFFITVPEIRRADAAKRKDAAFLLQVFSPSFISSPFSAFRAPFPLLRTAAQVLDGRNRATPLFQEDRTRNHHHHRRH